MKKPKKLRWLDKIRAWASQLPLLHRVVGLGFLVVVVVAAVAGFSASNEADAGQGDQFTSEARCSSGVRWNSSFRISNLGSIDWNQCKLELNAAGFGDGYSVLAPWIGARQTVEFGDTTFRRHDGTAYERAMNTPHRFTIRCLDVGGTSGAYIGVVSS